MLAVATLARHWLLSRVDKFSKGRMSRYQWKHLLFKRQKSLFINKKIIVVTPELLCVKDILHNNTHIRLGKAVLGTYFMENYETLLI